MGCVGGGRPWSVELGRLGSWWSFGLHEVGWSRYSLKEVKVATHGVASVGALLWGFRLSKVWFRGKYLPAGLHAVEALCVSASSLVHFVLLL